MDESLKHHNPNPFSTANPISKLFFWWMNPLFKTGYSRRLEIEDMYNVVPEDQSDVLGSRLENEWKKEVERSKTRGGKPSLLKCLIRIFGLEYMLLGIVLFLEESTKVCQPLLLGGLIRYFTPDSTMSRQDAFLYSMGVSLCAVTLAVLHHPYFFGVQRIGMKMRVACCSLLYRKSMRLSNHALGQTTTGQIVNLMSNDVNRFDQAVVFLHFLWIGPLEGIAVLAILWRELGPSTLAGFAVLLLLVPIQGWMGKLFSKFRQKTAAHTDERVRLMNEIISGMRVIKMYCWEKPFGELVEKIRSSEMKKIRASSYLRGLIIGLYVASGKLIIYLIFLIYTLVGGHMTPEGVFVAIAFVSAIHLSTTMFIPLAIQCATETRVTLKRVKGDRNWLITDIDIIQAIKKQLIIDKWAEIQMIWKVKPVCAVRDCSWYLLGDKILYLAVIVPYFYQHHPIRSRDLYLLVSYILLLQKTLLGFGLETAEYLAYFIVSTRRFQTFLMLDELESESGTKLASILRPKPEECCVTITDVTAKWDKKLEQTTLENISASVKAGQLLAVIGPVGAGKSSLLMTVLKELSVLDGSIQVKGCIAYASQQPWVFSASLRQNITFGNLYKKSKYDQILKACALNKDIELMPNGDLTLIGDRGVSLSGGQRARVSLARALYMDADVYLLDDPLSAVDATVGKHLFERVIQGMLKDKPRILVTHQLQFLKAADQILILKEGKMIGKGTFDELSTSGVDFSSLLKRDKEEEEKKEVDLMKQHSNINLRRRLDSTRSGRELSAHEVGSKMSITSIGTEFEAEEVQLPEEEERHKGTISFGIYVQYFKAGAGILKFILLAFLCLAAQGSYVMSDWWLSRWSNQEEAKHAARERDSHLRQQGYNETNITIPYVDTNLNIGVFSGIIGAVFFFGLLRALIFFKVAVDASKILHNQMFEKILRTQIGFFDSNPVGRILNRFSKDVGHMDDLLPVTFFDFVQCFLLIIGIVIVAGVINPWVFIPTVPLSVLFLVIRRYYLHTSRHIKRLEGTTRSPVFSHLSASLQGLHTIRAFNMQEKFVEEFDNHQDLHSESWFLFLTSSRWLAIRLDWLCALFVTAVSVSCVLAAASLNAGLVGLSMTYAMTLMGMFQWGVRQSAEVENQMVSVERVLDYCNLPSEAPLESIDSKKPPPDWPTDGVIIGKGAELRYGDDKPLVLKDLNFIINGMEKVGIVGRTGAGKSSLITMLFRLVEPCSGELVIDGINILETGLHDLRNKISIIPQDPVLFTGTLRRNLDPFSNHQDIALWNALEEVQLKDAIEELPDGLETEVSEGGINFSVGQRQLICLARAILRQNKILMIDEATANVDPRTDQLIQKTIREKFRNCTVLTIAHRLNTIMDSDRVLVLDEGRIVEFDHPHLLLLNPDGIFYKMVQQTSKSEKEHLLEIAKSAFVKVSSQSKTVDRDEASSDISLEVSSFDKESELFLTLPKVSESNISLCGSSIMDETGSIRSSEIQSQDGMFHSPVKIKSFLSDGTEDKKDENTDDLVDNRSGIVIKLKDVCDRMDESVNSAYEILSMPNGNNNAELDKPKIAPKENVFSSVPLSVGTYQSDLDEDDDSERETDESKALLEKSDGYSHNVEHNQNIPEKSDGYGLKVEPNQAVTAEESILQDHSNVETTSLLIQE